MKSIFVQIASYRDSELVPTIRDCLAKSSGENQINFGLVWQRDDSERLGEYGQMDSVRIIDVPWYESKGLGWARSLTQSLYKNEDYTLQLDSHHRFTKDWDTILINMLEGLKDQSPKPFLTSYAPGYDPSDDRFLNPTPCKVLPHDFKSSGTIWFNPVLMSDYKTVNRPVRAVLASGHFFFTLGNHCVEYKYDPDLYFAGDEITLTVRSYTMGYDLYHPHVSVVWHHYGRNDRPKHWGDHDNKAKLSNVIDKTWGERDSISKEKIRFLLAGGDLGDYGLGKDRSLADFEKYSGIDFKKKRIQKRTIMGYEPPVSYENEDQWNKEFEKITPINIREWPIAAYIPYLHKIEKIEVEFFNLQMKIIHKEVLSADDVGGIKDGAFKTVIVSDYYPMRVLFKAYIGGKVIHDWERDMRPNIHWG